MGFQLKQSTEGYFYPISLPVMTENGTSRIERFDMKFRRLSRVQINELMARTKEQKDEEFEVDALESDVDFVMEVSEGWRHVSGPDGGDLAFTRENVWMALNQFPSAAGTIAKAFYESSTGGGAKRKN